MKPPLRSILVQILEVLKAQKIQREVMSVADLADYLGISESWARELKDARLVPFVIIRGQDSRGRIVFLKTEIDKWLLTNSVNGVADERRLLDGRRKIAVHS